MNDTCDRCGRPLFHRSYGVGPDESECDAEGDSRSCRIVARARELLNEVHEADLLRLHEKLSESRAGRERAEAQRDARPDISREDAARVDRAEAGTLMTVDRDAAVRVTAALRAHAKGGT